MDKEVQDATLEPTYDELKARLKTAEERAAAAEQKCEKLASDLTKANDHIDNTFVVMKELDHIASLPTDVVSYMPRNKSDPAAILNAQMEARHERYLGSCLEMGDPFELVISDLDNLSLLASLPEGGATYAINTAVAWACCLADGEYHLCEISWVREDLQRLDDIMFSAVCIHLVEFGIGEGLRLYHPHLDIEAIRGAFRNHKNSSDVMARSSSFHRGLRDYGKLKEDGLLSLVADSWFSKSLTLLHELHKEVVTYPVVPKVVESILPAELMEMIFNFCYDAALVEKARREGRARAARSFVELQMD